MFQDGYHGMGTLFESSSTRINKVNGGAPYNPSTFQLSELKNKQFFFPDLHPSSKWHPVYPPLPPYLFRVADHRHRDDDLSAGRLELGVWQSGLASVLSAAETPALTTSLTTVCWTLGWPTHWHNESKYWHNDQHTENMVAHLYTHWHIDQHSDKLINMLAQWSICWHTGQQSGTLINTVAHWSTQWHIDQHAGTMINMLAHPSTPWHIDKYWHMNQHRGTLINTVAH